MYDTPDEAIAGITVLGGQPCSKCVANPNRLSPACAVMHPIAILNINKSFITFNRSTPVVRRWRNFLSCLSRHFGKFPGFRRLGLVKEPRCCFLALPSRGPLPV